MDNNEESRMRRLVILHGLLSGGVVPSANDGGYTTLIAGFELVLDEMEEDEKDTDQG